jgi:hypothetical protein
MLPTSNQFTFASGELVVKIPSVSGAALRAVNLAIGAVNMQPPSGFKPIRVVANVAIEREGQEGVYLTDLPQPVQISVRYRPSDQAAAAGKPLSLAFWDGKSWVRFTSAKHSFKLTPDADPSQGGLGSITITRWGDPPISWGT